MADLPAELELCRTPTAEPGRALRRLRSDTGTARADGDGDPSPLGRRLREWLLVPDSQAGWIPFAATRALKQARTVEVVLTTSPGSAHLAGALASRATRTPWVADFQDPWSTPAFQQWQGRWRPWIDKRLERAVVCRADRLVATTEWLAEHLASVGARQPPAVVANGYEPAEQPQASGSDEHFTLLHAGSFYGPRSPEPLLAAVAAALEAEPAMRACVRVRLLGLQDARNTARLAGSIRRLGLEQVVEQAGQVPRREALTAMRAAAVLTLVADPLEGGRGLIPLKLYEYLAAGRPLLALTPPDGEAGRLAQAAGGTVVHPSNVAAAASAVRRLYRGWQAGESGGHAPAELVERYRWDKLTAKLAHILDDTAARRRP
nr:glycosyltransferase [Gaiella occulta]